MSRSSYAWPFRFSETKAVKRARPVSYTSTCAMLYTSTPALPIHKYTSFAYRPTSIVCFRTDRRHNFPVRYMSVCRLPLTSNFSPFVLLHHGNHIMIATKHTICHIQPVTDRPPEQDTCGENILSKASCSSFNNKSVYTTHKTAYPPMLDRIIWKCSCIHFFCFCFWATCFGPLFCCKTILCTIWCACRNVHDQRRRVPTSLNALHVDTLGRSRTFTELLATESK